MLRTSLLGILLATASGGAISGQEIVEIDSEAGRLVFADTLYRSMEAATAVVDWTGRLVYVKDREEPQGIMVFSLNTGEWVRTISTPRGDGPGEFPQGRRAFAVAPDGGLYVAGFVRVVEYDSSGTVIGNWTPVRPPTQKICNMGGVPTVPTQGGIVRRTSDNRSQSVGSARSVGNVLGVTGRESDITATALRYTLHTHIACSDETAYVITAFELGPARVDVYNLDNTTDSLVVPPESARGTVCTNQETGEPCPHWSWRVRASTDEHGNLILLSPDPITHGAIINPGTGCYALIRADSALRLQPVAVHGDSVVTLHTEVKQTVVNGQPATTTDPNSAIGVSINPIRRVSGEPCAGVLPDVPPAS